MPLSTCCRHSSTNRTNRCVLWRKSSHLPVRPSSGKTVHKPKFCQIKTCLFLPPLSSLIRCKRNFFNNIYINYLLIYVVAVRYYELEHRQKHKGGPPWISAQHNIRATTGDSTRQNTDKIHKPRHRIEINIPNFSGKRTRDRGLEGMNTAKLHNSQKRLKFIKKYSCKNI